MRRPVGHGVVVGLAVLVPVVSYPSLVFSGPLQAFSGIGVGLGLLSAPGADDALVIGGSVGGTVGVAQSEPAIVLGVIATSMAADLRSAGAEDQVLPTVMAAVIISALAVGAVFLLLGTLARGKPHPVHALSPHRRFHRRHGLAPPQRRGASSNRLATSS